MELEQQLGYTFKNKALLEQALTHSSYANENCRGQRDCNERLEFLGDSVLGFVTAEFLFAALPDRPEGELTRQRADLVCEKNLAAVATGIGLGNYLRLGHGEAQGGGRTRPSILADATEAVLAAIYLDGGLESASEVIHRLILEAEDSQIRFRDYKTALQELVQRQKDQVLAYELAGESGPDHDKTFECRVRLNGRIVGQGAGRSKKRAEQAAAQQAIAALFPEEQ